MSQIPTFSAHTLTSTFINLTGQLSALRLHSLLYLSQGMSLVHMDQPLFREEIQAWQYGPVIPEVYKYHRGQQVLTSYFAPANTDPELRFFLTNIIEASQNLSSDDIRAQTPWVHNYTSTPATTQGTQTIALSQMREFFTEHPLF